MMNKDLRVQQDIKREVLPISAALDYWEVSPYHPCTRTTSAPAFERCQAHQCPSLAITQQNGHLS